jgi:hypothetical protein
MDDALVQLPANHPATRRLRLHHAARHRHVLRVVWTSTWSVHALQFGPRQARQHTIVQAHNLEQHGR